MERETRRVCASVRTRTNSRTRGSARTSVTLTANSTRHAPPRRRGERGPSPSQRTTARRAHIPITMHATWPWPCSMYRSKYHLCNARVRGAITKPSNTSPTQEQCRPSAPPDDAHLDLEWQRSEAISPVTSQLSRVLGVALLRAQSSRKEGRCRKSSRTTSQAHQNCGTKQLCLTHGTQTHTAVRRSPPLVSANVVWPNGPG